MIGLVNNAIFSILLVENNVSDAGRINIRMLNPMDIKQAIGFVLRVTNTTLRAEENVIHVTNPGTDSRPEIKIKVTEGSGLVLNVMVITLHGEPHVLNVTPQEKIRILPRLHRLHKTTIIVMALILKTFLNH